MGIPSQSIVTRNSLLNRACRVVAAPAIALMLMGAFGIGTHSRITFHLVR